MATTAILYLTIVPAALAFLDLTLGGLRVILRVAAVIGLAIGVTGILVFVVTGSNNALTPGQLISAAYLWLDTANRTASYSAAGHPPLIRWTNGRFERTESNGCLLGMVQECAYPVVTMDIRSGERFLMYTDGVVEVENTRGEFFGDSQLEEVVRNGQSLSPGELSVKLQSEIDQWRPISTPQQDDITLVVVDVV